MQSYREPQYSRIRESQEETLWGKGWGALADTAEGHCSEEFKTAEVKIEPAGILSPTLTNNFPVESNF